MISAGSGGRKSEKKVPTDSGAAEDLLPGSLHPHRVLGSPSSPKGSGPAGSRPHFTFVTPHSRICTQNPPRGGGRGASACAFWGTLSPQSSPCGRGASGASHPIAMGLLWDLVYGTRALLMEAQLSVRLPTFCCFSDLHKLLSLLAAPPRTTWPQGASECTGPD